MDPLFDVIILMIFKMVAGAILFFAGLWVVWTALCYFLKACIDPAIILYCKWRSETEIFRDTSELNRTSTKLFGMTAEDKQDDLYDKARRHYHLCEEKH